MVILGPAYYIDERIGTSLQSIFRTGLPAFRANLGFGDNATIDGCYYVFVKKPPGKLGTQVDSCLASSVAERDEWKTLVVIDVAV